MEYVNLGSAGVKVSRLALGLALRGQGDAAATERMISHALDFGINLVDCANAYGLMNDPENAGSSEVILGKALEGRRDDVVITSKVFSPVGPGPNDSGSSRYHIVREVERSLKRLDTDRIDVHILHAFDATTMLEETIRALDDLVRQGKVRYVGCSNFTAWQVCKGLWVADRLNAVPFMCVQNSYSLMDRRLESEMFGLVRDQGLGIMAYSPLGIGLLSGAYRPCEKPSPDTFWGSGRRELFESNLSGQTTSVLETVRQVASEVGKSVAQVALAWVLSHPEIAVAISGGDTIEHIEDNVGALGWELPREARERLDTVSASMLQGLRDD
jgi:aryl-alcohol dehydrogenase-like predicted oxidoreductase